MWAIAARTMGRVKEIDDDDKRTPQRKEENLSIKHEIQVVYEHVIVPSSVHLHCPPSSFSTHDPCPSLVITPPAPLPIELAS